MKRLTTQLSASLLAALFSLMALATLPGAGDGVQDLAERGPIGSTGTRFLGFAVRFVLARFLWGA